ncbi:MAG: ATP-binding cassette domain-containing protein [Granulosicoccus sp.]|nr:ATP-binding cassette domain-containing protein [Granulosicoccus sp.]
MLSFKEVACRRDGKRLFGNVNCVIHAGQKVGLTGANGTGKSSLFSMIQGTLEPDSGSISLQQSVSITHVAQETPSSERSALDYVVDGDALVRQLQKSIAQCTDEEGERRASLLADLDQAGGYTVLSRAGALLNGLGFATSQHQWPVSRFSGGWRMRLNLAQALMSPNELLLLDEPTNHLDLDAVLWLETWLRQREGTLILVSHDREFLDAVTNMTLHIENGNVDLVTGNYSAFERWRAARLSNQQSAHEKAQARRRELQGFVDRFRAKATKARQAQSRLKMLERMGETQAVRPDSPFTFSFRAPDSNPNPLLVLQQAALGYGNTSVLENVNLTIQSGDRIGLLGVNGAGKSTLIKALTGSLALISGNRVPAQKLRIGYFAQHQVDQLRSDQSPLQAVTAHDPTLSETQARTFLGTFGFVGDQALQSASTLSGGERARLALALIVQARPNLLLLDEPTNHLDIVMRQALADALVGFDGALMVISHDRTMLRTVVDDLWLVAAGSVTPFDDDLDGYARWLASQRQSAVDDAATIRGVADSLPADRRTRKRLDAEKRAQLAPLNRAVTQHERELDRAAHCLAEIRGKLSDDGLYNSDRKVKLNDILAEEVAARRAVDAAEEKLLESMEALESASNGDADYL